MSSCDNESHNLRQLQESVALNQNEIVSSCEKKTSLISEKKQELHMTFSKNSSQDNVMYF